MYRGYNDFYDGWLARYVDTSFDANQSPEWQLGWQTADETPPLDRKFALGAEINSGHIFVVSDHSPV